MRRYAHYALVIATLACVTTSAVSAQSSWDRYQTGTLTAIVERHRALTDTIGGAAQKFFIMTQTFPTRATLIFAGTVRPIAEDDRQLLVRWAKTMRIDTSLVLDYREEWLFREGQAEYWLPFQEETAESMRPVVQKGDSVTVWAQFFGGVKRGSHTSWVFPVMRSQSYR